MDIKGLVKRNHSILGLCSMLFSLLSILMKDFAKIRKASLVLSVATYTMLPYPRPSKLCEIATHMERERIDGSFVECGVCNGGSAGVIAKVAEHNQDRHVWLFDSWEGVPELTKYDVSCTGEKGVKGRGSNCSEVKVKELMFKKLKLNNDNVHLVKGDVRYMRDFEESSRGGDVVFPLAAITSVPYSFESTTITSKVNAEGAGILLKTSASSGEKRFANVSPCAVYEDPECLPIDE